MEISNLAPEARSFQRNPYIPKIIERSLERPKQGKFKVFWLKQNTALLATYLSDVQLSKCDIRQISFAKMIYEKLDIGQKKCPFRGGGYSFIVSVSPIADKL